MNINMNMHNHNVNNFNFQLSTNMHVNNVKNNNSTCNNCGKQGHLFHQCKLPVISYGVVAFRHSEHGLQFLMIRRKDSFGYIDLIRGKYSANNIDHVQNMINEMSVVEKERIIREPFDKLCKLMWGNGNNSQYKSEETISQKKFESLKCGNNNSATETTTLQSLVDNSCTTWQETEWEFPKGRRNYQEKDIDCALREFSEETGYSEKDITIVANVLPFEEIFVGSNYKSYKHKYYLAYMNNSNKHDNPDSLQKYQTSEVSKIDWKTYDECIESIRPYNLEKKQLITNIHTVLTEYRLY